MHRLDGSISRHGLLVLGELDYEPCQDSEVVGGGRGGGGGGRGRGSAGSGRNKKLTKPSVRVAVRYEPPNGLK
jgi:hypothetical protein